MGWDSFGDMGGGGVDVPGIFKSIVNFMVPQEEQSEVPLNFAAAASAKAAEAEGKSKRDILYEDLLNRDNALHQKRTELMNAMDGGQEMTKAQTAGMMLVGLLPMLAGGLAKGKKGLAIGAQAGGLGTTLLQKGIENDQVKLQKRSLAELDNVDNEIKSNADFKNKANLDQLTAEETAAQRELDRNTRLDVAGINNQGAGKIASAMGKGLDNLAKSQTAAKVSSPIVIDNTVYTPTDAVDKESYNNAIDAAANYQGAISALKDIVQTSQSLDAPAFQRALGATGSDLHQKYVLAQNYIMAAKKIPGLKGTEAIKNLDDLISDPSSIWTNARKLIPGTAKVNDELGNAVSNLDVDFKRFLQLNKFNSATVGQTVYKNGSPFKITAVYPNGRVDAEPAEAQ